MHIWCGTVGVERLAGWNGQCRRSRGGNDHGQQADGQHRPVRHVHVDGESAGSGGHRGSDGSVDTDALHPQRAWAMGAGIADGHDWQQAGVEQLLESDLRFRRVNLDHGAGPVHGDGPMTPVTAHCDVGHFSRGREMDYGMGSHTSWRYPCPVT